MGDSSKFWEIMATVIPVIALAFVVEVRYLRLHEMGPFRRLATALTHAATIAILLFSEVAALTALSGPPQAAWAAHVALYGCVAALAVVLWTPATKLIIVAFFGTSRAVYVHYWKASRLLAQHRRLVKKQERQLIKHERIRRDADELIGRRTTRSKVMPERDLRTIWAKQSFDSKTDEVHEIRAAVSSELVNIKRDIRDSKKSISKTEREMIKLAGRKSKQLSHLLDKHM